MAFADTEAFVVFLGLERRVTGKHLVGTLEKIVGSPQQVVVFHAFFKTDSFLASVFYKLLYILLQLHVLAE